MVVHDGLTVGAAAARFIVSAKTAAKWVGSCPVAVSVIAALPAVVVAGERELSTGDGLLIVKVTGAEVPPPGAGVCTVTFAVPAVARSD